jgi:hypothetical protein
MAEAAAKAGLAALVSCPGHARPNFWQQAKDKKACHGFRSRLSASGEGFW